MRKVHYSMGENIIRWMGNIALALFAVFCLIPFLIVIGSSFTSETEIIRNGYSIWPRKWSVASYQQIFSNPVRILQAYGVTTTVTIIGTMGSVFLNIMTAYVLCRRDFLWRNKFSFYYFFTTLFSGGLMPWYLLCVKYLHLKDSLLALILPGMISVWNILLAKGFIAGVPYELTEAAKIDGAGDFAIFIRVIWPISKPIIATIGLFSALVYWNDWYNSMLLIDNENLYSLQYLLYKLVNDAKELRQLAEESGIVVETEPIESMKMALTVVVTGPILFAYPFVQKFFVKGLTIGAVKG